jgi:rubrerythrin
VADKIHLRHILEIGVTIEEKGKLFYEQLAVRVKNDTVKNLCLNIAKDELAHKEFIKGMLDDWLPLDMDSAIFIELNKFIDKFDIYKDPPGENASEQEMARYAISQEYRNAEFYLSFERMFPELWKKMNLERLVIEERVHAESLLEIYPVDKI